MKNLTKAPILYIATQKAIIFVHQNSEWISKPEDQPIFKKAFKIALGSLNKSARKMIEIFGIECADFAAQNKFFEGVMSNYNKFDGDALLMSINIEKDFLRLSERLYEHFRGNGMMSSDLEEFMMSNASEHEEIVSLLQNLSHNSI